MLIGSVFIQQTLLLRSCSRCIVANVLNYYIVGSEFKLNLCHCVYFWTINPLGR